MQDYSAFYLAREKIVEILQKDLVGPVEEDEVLSELPLQYYVMGKLYPQNNDGEIVDTARTPVLESEVDNYDTSLSLCNARNPSSMGITFTLKNEIRDLQVEIKFAHYISIPYADALVHGIDISKREPSSKKQSCFWQRTRESLTQQISLIPGKKLYTYHCNFGVELQIYVHKVFEDGECVITAALLNTNSTDTEPENTNRLAIFQPQILISATEEKKENIFTSVRRQVDMTIDPEILDLDLLYRDTNCYAQGHGCSVIWDTDSNEPLWIKSTFFPSYNLMQMKPSSFGEPGIFRMRYLATANARDICESLSIYMSLYEDWIKQIEHTADEFSGQIHGAAYANIAKCKNALAQIRKTIEELQISAKGDGKVWTAFQLANEAMYMQRVQTIIRKGEEIDNEKICWYPFQLAFILHELISFILPEGEERKKVDLLWFPTGGGKTEAYLGIAAFVIFLRRIRDPLNGGVAVLMRYTLRLLTLQQFERASMLICACEILRIRNKYDSEPISIGLWVGGKLTPNSFLEAKQSIDKQKMGTIPDKGETDPCQIRVCPWCGMRIDSSCYSADSLLNQIIIRCPNKICYFAKGLPVHIIDEEIYKYLPTFIVATVDKFAQIPLNDKPSALFGITSGKNPPELIIQDELHLLSGPLGTMTGIYEAAITKLCENNGIPAKVIASTATIRNAANQIRALYGRQYTQFPPQGINIKNSFFAIESSKQDSPARMYTAVMGVGTTSTTTLIRVNAALLFASRYLIDLGYDDKVVDNFWTLTGYFNSLRELGGASTQILDDVQSRFHYLVDTKFAKTYCGFSGEEKYSHTEELTSRMGNAEISKIIQEGLKKSFKRGSHIDVYDFILASNMISVGVDIGRLGTMVVAGQPKTNSEYIQATSRVGRDNPGLVVMVYNGSRSRDRSHYEQFYRYHSALYRYVEATSLTPFSDRARDRGLHALYVALCRYLIPDLRGNRNAVNFRRSMKGVFEIEETIRNYVKEVDPKELSCVDREVKEIADEWEERASGTLEYHNKFKKKTLLRPDTDNDRFRTMNSMRSVDGESGIYLLGG